MRRSQVEQARRAACTMLEDAGIALTQRECDGIEIADFGLGDFEKTGLAIVVYENNDRYCAKELVMLPRQSCPEHRHPPVGSDPGKMETFRCRWGKLWVYSSGQPVAKLKARVPAGSEAYHTVFHEAELNPGDQYTIQSDTLHWFQAGDDGCIVSEFSSTSRDELDLFTDPRIKRTSPIEEGR